jgi:drug/metabolite transporter (DMT)-like permease
MNKETKDNLLYLSIGLGVAALILAPLLLAIIQNREIPDFPLKPVFLVGSTLILVAYVIQDCVRRQVTLRQVLPILLCVVLFHLVAFGFILHTLERVPLLLLSAGVFIEAYVALVIIDRVTIRPSAREAE